MPAGLRFCRNCGFRLGEGSAEYTETVRLPNAPGLNVGARVGAPYITTYGLSGDLASQAAGTMQRRKRKMSGMTWIFMGLLMFFICAGVFTAFIAPTGRSFGGMRIKTPAPPVPKSFFGVSGFEDSEVGVTFDDVEPPGSPADKAGLVGGDVITTFDGKKVESSDQMSDILRETPIGKTVDVVFIRDGETKTTKLTTVSKEDADRIGAAFRNRPEGRGQFGYDDDNAERVEIPGTKMFGVKVNDILQSRPADLAGVKEGDIIIEFDSVPIRTPEELRSRIQRAVPYSTVNVTLIRGTEQIKLPVKMGKQ